MIKNKKKFSSGRVLIWIGLLLITAALILTGKNIWDMTRAERRSQAVTKELLPEVEAAKNRNRSESDKAARVIPDYMLNPDMEMPTKQIDGKNYIGVLSVPDLELELPVLESWSYPDLKIAPCRYVGTAYKNNFVLCAHNYDAHFGKLKYLNEGDEVIFTDMDGNEFHYEVAELETLKPTAIEEMITEGWDLTLFTCTIGGAARITVRCMLQKNEI